MSPVSPCDRDLDRNLANDAPLTPLSPLARTACTYPDRVAVIHGEAQILLTDTEFAPTVGKALAWLTTKPRVVFAELPKTSTGKIRDFLTGGHP